jgi:hypothetical protein
MHLLCIATEIKMNIKMEATNNPDEWVLKPLISHAGWLLQNVTLWPKQQVLFGFGRMQTKYKKWVNNCE